jgi:hypothetical protein
MQATENVAEVAKDTFLNVLDYDIHNYLNFLSYHSYKIKKQNDKIH